MRSTRNFKNCHYTNMNTDKFVEKIYINIIVLL